MSELDDKLEYWCDWKPANFDGAAVHGLLETVKLCDAEIKRLRHDLAKALANHSADLSSVNGSES